MNYRLNLDHSRLFLLLCHICGTWRLLAAIDTCAACRRGRVAANDDRAERFTRADDMAGL